MRVGRIAYGIGFLVCGLLIITALVFEHVLDLEPCPLCMIQRLVVVLLGLMFLLACIHGPKKLGQRIYGGLTILIASFGIAVAGRHVWLQNLPEDQVPECGPGLGYILEVFPLRKAVDIILQGSGECHEVSWSFLGLTIPGWTLVAFAFFCMFGFWQLTDTQTKTSTT